MAEAEATGDRQVSRCHERLLALSAVSWLLLLVLWNFAGGGDASFNCANIYGILSGCAFESCSGVAYFSFVLLP